MRYILRRIGDGMLKGIGIALGLLTTGLIAVTVSGTNSGAEGAVILSLAPVNSGSNLACNSTRRFACCL